MIEQKLMSMNEKYPDTIAVLGGAYFAYDAISNGDIATFVEFLPHVAQSAKFLKWHNGVAGALRQFCHLCLVDPSLIEVYLGTTFNEIAQHYTQGGVENGSLCCC